MSWIAGVFYSSDEIEGDPYQLAYFDDWLLTRGDNAWDQDTEAAAVFGHGDWLLTDRFHLTAGLRYTWEQKQFQARTRDLNPFGASCLLDAFCDPGFVGPVTLAATDEEISAIDLSGKLGLEVAPNQDLLLYGSVSKGFKSGGFSGGFSLSNFQLQLAGVVGGLMEMTPPDLPDVSFADVRRGASMLGPLRRLGRKRIPELARVLPMSVTDLLDEFFESPAVKGAIGASAILGVS